MSRGVAGCGLMDLRGCPVGAVATAQAGPASALTALSAVRLDQVVRDEVGPAQPAGGEATALDQLAHAPLANAEALGGGAHGKIARHA